MPQIDYAARKAAASRTFAELSAARNTPKAQAMYSAERLCKRSLRVLAGIALAVVGFIVIQLAPEVSDTPFSALTLGAISKSLACWGFGLWFFWWAFLAAFGAGPTKAEIAERLQRQAEGMADARAQMFGGDYSR